MKRNGERDRRFGVVFVIFHGSACSVREEEGTVVRIGEKKEREKEGCTPAVFCSRPERSFFFNREF